MIVWVMFCLAAMHIDPGESNGCCSGPILSWISSSEQGKTMLSVVRGDPRKYLKGIYKPEFFKLMWWSAPIKEFEYQSLAFDTERSRIALSEGYTPSIVIVNLSENETNPQMLMIDVLPLSNNISGLAFASKGKLLYWVDLTYRYVGVVNMETYHWHQILTRLNSPHSIAVHEEMGFIFWSELEPPQIFRSDMRGLNDLSFGIGGMVRPVNLMVDKARNKLFWLDENLASSDFNGGSFTTYEARNTNMKSILSFSIFEDIVMFGTEGNSFVIYTFSSDNKLTPSGSTAFRSHKTIISQTFVLVKPRNTTGEHELADERKCERICMHLCIPMNDTNYYCGCRFGYILNDDGSSCNVGMVAPDGIFVGDRKRGAIYQIDTSTWSINVIVEVYPNRIESMAYHSYDGKRLLYYVENDLRKVIRYDIDTNEQILYFEAEHPIVDIAANETESYLYAADISGQIYEVRWNHSRRLLVSDNQSIILRLFLRPNKRMLFYSDCSKKSIIGVNLEGAEEIEPIPVGICAYSFAIDFNSDEVFVSGRDTTIIIYSLKTKMMTTSIQRNDLILDILVVDDFVYVAETKYVVKMNRSLKQLTSSKNVFYSAGDIFLVEDKPTPPPAWLSYRYMLFFLIISASIIPVILLVGKINQKARMSKDRKVEEQKLAKVAKEKQTSKSTKQEKGKKTKKKPETTNKVTKPQNETAKERPKQAAGVTSTGSNGELKTPSEATFEAAKSPSNMIEPPKVPAEVTRKYQQKQQDRVEPHLQTVEMKRKKKN